ncbi:MAG: triose-phosphate isomerase [Candidatus Aminicenantes bacterium]|nr:triose-phosphate isomerase [Candidatus Aminicenantes bacterium]
MAKARKRPFIAGNWKMHGTLAEARALASAIVAAAPELAGADILLIPPFTALTEVGGLLAGTGIGLGAQDLFWEDGGAFTGQISGPMLKDAGCRFVLVGHSERRQYFGETDETVARKVRAALRSGLSPIVCFGETLEAREAGRTIERIDAQLDRGLGDLAAGEIASVLLAYEPVWAIGTGRTATPAQAEEVQAHIRGRLEEKYGNGPASCAIILYGGSVKPSGSYSLFKEKNIDGFLVGGASLDAGAFAAIAAEALRADREEK